jgi:flagellin
MGFSVNTNIDALNTYRNLNNVQNSLSSSLAKLSSGLRINNAGDDAAGLTIATSLGSQVSGLTQAARNAQDGTSVVQTADGALSQAQSLLQRLRDLAVQAGNDSNSPSARVAIKTEAKSITDELDRLGDSVNFNGTKLLNGQTPVLKFQIGADGDAASQVSVDLSGANLKGAASALGNGSYSSGTTVRGIVVANVPSTLNFVVTSPDGNTVSNIAATGLTASPAPTSLQDLADKLNANAAFSAKMTAIVGRTRTAHRPVSSSRATTAPRCT